MEIFDFTVNALRDMERKLDRTADRLAEVSEEQQAKVQALNQKLSDIEEKALILEENIRKLKKILYSQSKNTLQQVQGKSTFLEEITQRQCSRLIFAQWEDFIARANQPQLLTFESDEIQKKLTITAVKNNQILAYEGKLPELQLLLKPWLADQLQMLDRQDLIHGAILAAFDTIRAEYCPKCGAKRDHNEDYCSKCGSKF